MKMKLKSYKISIIALFAALIVSLCAFTFTLSASAADSEQRLVKLNGTSVFYTDVDASSVSAVREVNTVNGEEVIEDYALFSIGDGATVTHRSNLAYSWYTSEGNAKFSLTFGFKNLDFDRFIVKFQSQQYNKTEDGVTTNCIVFLPNADGTGVYAFFTQDEEEEFTVDSADVCYSAQNNARITVSFGEFSKGDYTVNITDGTNNGSGTFKNVKETYAKYVSSGTSAAMPLTFTADITDDNAAAEIALYEMNGQSFLLYDVDLDDDGNPTGGYVNDDTAPVICLESNVNYLEFGESIDLDYVVIDVIASSPRSTVNYYVLSATDYAKTDLDYDSTDTESEDYLFNEITSTTTVRLLRDADTFIPSYLLEPVGAEDDPTSGYEVYGLVKIYIKVTDVTSNGQSQNVFLDWYVADEYKVDIYGEQLKNGENSSYFIPIVEDTQGATFAKAADASVEDYKQTVAQIQADYQQKIDQAIADLEDGKLYAGSSNYFYLPDFSEYVADGVTYSTARDNLGGYTDFKFSIYYKTSSTGSSTSLAYNQLAINISEADVTYKFTIFITDAAGNAMFYPTVDTDGKIVYEEITTSDIWDEDFADLLPFFTFSVSYKPATVETPGEQSIAYVGTTYTSISFDITGISDTYTTSYKLYAFDRDLFYSDTGINLSYSEFVANLEALFNNDYAEIENTRKYFTTILALADLHEEDDNYETYADYAWDASALSFVPQSASEFYAVALTLTDTRSSQVTRAYMGIRASEQADALKGESQWIKNNLASVILLCIAGASLIGLIVLLVVKPKDKGDIDTIETGAGKKGKKNGKAKKNVDLDE